MKKTWFMAVGLWILFGISAGAQVMEFGFKATPEGITEIGFVYSEYYRVQPAVIVDLEKRRLPEDDMSVLLFLSGRAHVAPEVILKWRLAGESWWVITERLRLDPVTVYYVPIPDHVQPGPPFGKAYGYFKKRKHGKTLEQEVFAKGRGPLFDDDDIRNLVQLRLVSDYYRYRPEDVMARRSRGEHFRNIIKAEHEKKHGKKGLRDVLKEDKQERKEDRIEKWQRKGGEEHKGKKKHWN